MTRTLKKITTAAALLSAIAVMVGLAASPASAAQSVGFDAKHGFRIDTSYTNGQIMTCSTDPFSGTGFVRVALPYNVTSPVNNWVYFSVVLEQLVRGQWARYRESPWYYNWASPSGALYYSLWRELGTNRWFNAAYVGFVDIPAGTYRLNLNFFWGSDGRQAVHQTDSCRIGY